jgi:Fe2+ transport system protein FeoA
MSATRPVVPDESPTPSMPATLIRLDRLPVGASGVVVEIAARHRHELAREGVLPGRSLVVTGHAPFRGPILVSLGRANLALSRDVAAGVLVR